ncbi:hypothetical protein Pmani_010104 [Petrolisthes manimaculis]|uniref:RDD domain-containing protein n=1 Tax=Petrolisthes manimaculis TaxID=1843537 RepID=A0AAE1Q5M9_9EUCA|nr:hypothetical protein Pmani_010104 [Petrolisthes manimaculis]
MATSSDGTPVQDPQKKMDPRGSAPDHHPNSAEYVDTLRSWLTQVYHLHCLAASFPYFLASLQAAQSTLPPPSPPSATPAAAPSSQTTSPSSRTPPPQTNTEPQQQQQPQQRGVEYKIPPLWKRLLAEGIDFFLLLAIKLAVTFAAVDSFGFLTDIEKYDLETLGAGLLADYRLALNLTSDILILELIHRVGSCVFEALCLHRGTGGGVGGATPGKKMVGLRVVRCQWLAPTTPDQALIYPATDLGLCRAVVRSAVKTFSLTFLFPICFTFLSLHHSRTFYDVVAGSVVVEETPIRRPTPATTNNNNNDNNNNNMQ